jgi:hypothetical protein
MRVLLKLAFARSSLRALAKPFGLELMAERQSHGIAASLRSSQ